MAGDARDIELDKTVQAPLVLDATRDASLPPPPLAVGTEDTAATTQPSTSRPSGRLARTAHRIFLVTATLSAINVVFFVARFLLAAHPPQLHAKFLGQTRGGPFEAMALFDGPMLTLVRMTAIAVIYVAVAAWAAHHHRRDTTVQLFATTSAIAGQLSIAVAVLTSSETVVAWRALAAIIYVIMPLVSLSTIALFPTGKPVPRWSMYCVPLATLAFVAQAWVMYTRRDFSVPIASTYFASAALFIGFQWHRYRRHATLRERHQIKWLTYAGAAFAAIQAVAVVGLIPLLGDRERAAFPFLRVLFELLIASSYLVGLASLLFSAARYRLWDIDRVINRTIVYGVVTVLLGATCALGYFGLRAVLGSAIHGSAVSAGLAIAVMVLLFAPTRRRIARWIDRRFYGIGLDYEALAAKAVRAAHTNVPTTETVLGGYDDLVLLGRGGMGAVYRAHHADFGVPVALKVMSKELAADPSARARFRRESQILEGLQHPNVIPYLASGHEAGLEFIAMQYLEGEDLGALARKRGRLSLAETCPLIDGVAAALDLAHERGVVHRDIKPANVFIEGAPGQPIEARRALVMDFGVARLAGDPSAADGSLVGSLPYIAPEQIHDGDKVDGRADVYALGASVYQLLTGQPPFVESTALGLVLAHLHQPPVDPRSHAPALAPHAAEAILKALAKDPANRFETAGLFAAGLRGSLRQ